MKIFKLLLVFGLILAMLCMVVCAADGDFVPSAEQSGGAVNGDSDSGNIDAPTTDVQSPQTGVSEAGVAAAAVSVVIFSAGAVVLGKKLKENVA